MLRVFEKHANSDGDTVRKYKLGRRDSHNSRRKLSPDNNLKVVTVGLPGHIRRNCWYRSPSSKTNYVKKENVTFYILAENFYFRFVSYVFLFQRVSFLGGFIKLFTATMVSFFFDTIASLRY